MMKRFFLCVLVVFMLLPPADARAGGYDDVVDLELIEGWRRADGSHMAGLRIRLAPGWKTYWRAPGEAGIPPRLRLDAAAGLEGARLHWPVPEVWHANGMRSVGYRSDVVFPLELSLADGAGPVVLSGRIEIGVCQDICMPVLLDLSGELPVDGRRNAQIAAALADRPETAAEAGAGPARCALSPIADGLRVEARLRLPRLSGDETVVFELPGEGMWISEAQSHREGRVLVASADIVPPDAGPFALDRSALRITVLGGGRAVEILGCRAG